MSDFMVAESYDYDYDYIHRRIVMESVQDLSLFKTFLPKAAELLRSYLPNLSNLADTQTAKLTNKSRRDVVTKLSKNSFITYEDTLVFVPEGFKGKYEDFMDVLLAVGKSITFDAVKVVADYNTELAIFLSNADLRNAVKSHTAHYEKIKKTRENHTKHIEAYFKSNTTLSRQKLSSVADRFQDFVSIFNKEEELRALKARQNYQALIGEVQKTNDLLLLIKARLESGDIGKFSSQVAKNLADGSYEVAKYIEFVAIYGYRLESLLASINNTADLFDRIM
jgi:hypothetical protein